MYFVEQAKIALENYENHKFLGNITGYFNCWISNLSIPQGFSSILLKPNRKAVTRSEEVGRWRTLMVECVTVFFII